MAVRPVIVCDVCGRDKPAEHYRITYPDGMSWEVDLCDTPHEVRLQHFRDKGIGHEVKRGGRRAFTVTPMEDIGKPRAAKKATPAKPKKRP